MNNDHDYVYQKYNHSNNNRDTILESPTVPEAFHLLDDLRVARGILAPGLRGVGLSSRATVPGHAHPLSNVHVIKVLEYTGGIIVAVTLIQDSCEPGVDPRKTVGDMHGEDGAQEPWKGCFATGRIETPGKLGVEVAEIGGRDFKKCEILRGIER